MTVAETIMEAVKSIEEYGIAQSISDFSILFGSNGGLDIALIAA